MGDSMSEAAPEAPPAPAAQPPNGQQDAPPDPQQDLTDWKAEARKWEQRAKENGTKASALEKAQRAAMTDADRAVAEAEARGRTAAATQYGARIARTEFDAAAARRNPDFDTSSALEYVDLAKFVGEDGEPDMAAIKKAVTKLVPEPSGGTPSFDGGARQSPPTAEDMNMRIRRSAGLA